MPKKITPEQLIKRYLDGNCTPDENALVESWHLEDFKNSDELPTIQEIDDAHQQMRETIIAHTQVERISPSTVRPFRLWIRVAAAAVLLIGLTTGGYLLLHKPLTRLQVVKNHDLAPGRNQATLTLSNGQKIYLTTSIIGKLAQQGTTVIQMAKGGVVTYNGAPEKVDGQGIAYNTLTTKRGEQFPLVLSDGTRVFLNSASSITYPVAFNGADRQVTVTGEAFFDVVHDAAHPFKVKVANQTVEDIGTSFNVNAYDDEPLVKTTLVTGRAKIISKQQSIMLKPGQAAISDHGSEKMIIKNVDVDQAIAWKNNYFLFDGDNLESIMRKVSRWYDVDVEYKDNGLKTQIFSGTVSRFKNVSSVLKKLELTGAVHFELSDKKIIVIK
jgi:transmembrane sensor